MRARIGAYARISFDGEGEGLGVARQRADVGKLADLKGWDVARYYTDNNLSAFKRNVIRPEFEQMITDLTNGDLDGIVAYDLDRITRQPADLERIVRIYEERPGLLFATVAGDFDLSKSDGLFMARTLINVANKSSADTSRRIKRKNLERAERGLPHGSRRPFGYAEDQLSLHPVEAPIVQEIGRRILNGEGYKHIAWWLNGKGITTTEGKLWYSLTVRNTVRRTRYAGFRVYEGKEYAGVWQPIFDRQTWEDIQNVIKRRKEKANYIPVSKKYLLTGLLVCGKCGSYLNGATKRDHPGRPLRRTYLCRPQGFAQYEGGCGGVTRNADAIEHFMRELICYRLDTPDLASLLKAPDKRTPELLNEWTRLVERKNALVDDYADGTLSKLDFQRAQDRVEQRMKQIDSEIDRLRREQLDLDLKPGETVRAAWMSRDTTWRRDLVDVLVKRITVRPGITKPFYDVDGIKMRFDPLLIDILWRV